VPGFGPERRERSHAYSGNSPNSRRVVRACEIFTASAAMGGTAPLIADVVVVGFEACGLRRERSLRDWAAMEGDFDCRYART
jgi:hypothetical protein